MASVASDEPKIKRRKLQYDRIPHFLHLDSLCSRSEMSSDELAHHRELDRLRKRISRLITL